MLESWVEYLIFFSAGVVAGGMNTVAGGGSMFIMSLLMLLGFPAAKANGTNSLGILLQNLAGSFTFYRGGFLDIKKSLWFVVPAVVGAGAGSWFVHEIPTNVLDRVASSLMLLLLFVMVLKLEKKPWLKEGMKHWSARRSKAVQIIFFFCVGVYSSFVQAGMGVVILIALTGFTSLSIIRMNAIKMVVIGLFAIPLFIIFYLRDEVVWLPALLLAAGQLAGTWIASKFFLHKPYLAVWADRLVMVVVLFAVARAFDVFKWLPLPW